MVIAIRLKTVSVSVHAFLAEWISAIAARIDFKPHKLAQNKDYVCVAIWIQS